ncbi:MAG TPA: hypothetical protein VGU66_07410 [Candidatus Elarobacter sp.]|nr:hypothetical protein [Candidatus Elarobacter sp.]
MLNRFQFALSAFAVFATPRSIALAADAPAAPAGLQSAIEGIVAEFSARAHAAGLPPDVVRPNVVLRTTPALSVYTPQGIVIAEWRGLPPLAQAQFDAWATAAGPSWSGARVFEEMFHWFLVPHEMTHWVQTRGGTQRFTDRYESEAEANRVAVAYWRRTDADRARLDALVTALTALYAKLPSPVPNGADPAQYFQTKYDMLVVDPGAYGWYQLRMIIDAYKAQSPPLDTMLQALVARVYRS